MSARATAKTFGMFPSIEAVRSVLSLGSLDPDHVPSIGDTVGFIDAQGDPKSAFFAQDGWAIIADVRESGEGVPGIGYGVFDDLAAAQAAHPDAPAGSWATTRDGNMLVFQGGA